ncbi:hypothetical protein BKA82DRAFT_2574258 [Pisolithus tinctorius]|nr:hypothetical protein BKA82DRAFT_2574258 [Pisolithus tinctorius]
MTREHRIQSWDLQIRRRFDSVVSVSGFFVLDRWNLERSRHSVTVILGSDRYDTTRWEDGRMGSKLSGNAGRHWDCSEHHKRLCFPCSSPQDASTYIDTSNNSLQMGNLSAPQQLVTRMPHLVAPSNGQYSMSCMVCRALGCSLMHLGLYLRACLCFWIRGLPLDAPACPLVPSGVTCLALGAHGWLSPDRAVGLVVVCGMPYEAIRY